MEEQQTQQTVPQAEEKEGFDISRKTLIVLVVLSVAISVIGSVAMIYELSSAKVAPIYVDGRNTVADANVGFTIIGGEDNEPYHDKATGLATFTIGD